MKRRRDIKLWSWAALIALGTIVLLAAGAWARVRQDSTEAVILMVPVLFTILGVIMGTKVPENRLYLLFLWIGAALLTANWAEVLKPSGPPDDPSSVEALAIIWANASDWVGLFIPLALLMHLFPTGEFLSRRWRWARWAALIGALTVVVAETAPREVYPYGPDGKDWTIPNPLGFMESATMEAPPFVFILGLTVLPLILGGLPAMVVRYRRSGRMVKSQIKWVLLSLLLFVLVGLMPAMFFDVYGMNLVATIVFVPISIALAITRYRLYDIDRILSRSVAYALVVGLLAVIYLGGAVWLPTQVLGEQSPVFVAGTTLAIAALFNPVRRRIVAWVDRRFNRSRYDAERVVAQFRHDLRDRVDLERLSKDSLEVVDQTFQPSSMGIWLRN